MTAIPATQPTPEQLAADGHNTYRRIMEAS